MPSFVARYRRALALLAAIAVPIGVAVLLVPFRGTFANTAAALVLVVVVLALAIAADRLTGVLASASAALWFDFFLTRPYERFAISHRPAIETTVAIVVVGLLVNELAATSHRRSRVSREEAHFLDTIRDLAALGAAATPGSEMVTSAATSLTDLLHLRACRFERVAPSPPLARLRADGDVEHVGLHWPVGEIGIPGPEAEIAAEWHGRVLGYFILTPTPGQPVALERRVVAVALATIAAARLDVERRGP